MRESDLIIRLDSIQEKTVKDGGIIYTPWNIVQSMVEIAKPTPDMNIIEPSCGHGAFLIGLLCCMNEKHGFAGEKPYERFVKKVSCVEILENTTIELKEILSAYFLKHFKLSVKTDSFTNVYRHDGLTFDNGVHFNLCIGNPPYIRAKNLDPGYLKFLKENYASCKKGTADICLAFIERYSNTAESLVFVTLNSFSTNNTGVVLKRLLIDKLTLLVDFKEKKIFKDASFYTCIFKTVLNNPATEMSYGNDLNKLSFISKTEIFNIINISNLLNKYRKIVFTSGFVVPQNKENKIACSYILDEKFFDFAKKNGKVWAGKDESYFSITSR